MQNSNCILFLQDHRTQLWHYLTRKKKIIATLKLIQLLRKFTCRHLRVSLLNAISLKEIEQVVFAYYNFNNFPQNPYEFLSLSLSSYHAAFLHLAVWEVIPNII